MSDRKESAQSVQVELVLHDREVVPATKHTKIIEIYRDEWNSMESFERKDHVEDLLHVWLEEKFDLSYEALGTDDFDDVAEE